MAEAQGDQVLMIRGVLDLSQPYQELENLGRRGSEGVSVMSTSGAPGTTSATASRERATRAIERQGDQSDAEQASFNTGARAASRNAERRQSAWDGPGPVGVWGDIASGGAGGGAMGGGGRGGRMVRVSTGGVRKAYRKNEYTEDWESAVNSLFESDPWEKPQDQGPWGGNREASIEYARRGSVRQSNLRATTARWNHPAPGSVPFDEFDSENFGSNLDEAIGDAESKLPVTPKLGFKARYNKMVRGGTNPLNTNLSYFGRFMAVEGVRTFTAIGNAGRDFNLGQIAAKGNLTAEAVNEINYRNNIANSAPLGVGELARLIRDPDGSEEGSVRGVINYTDAQEQIGAQRGAARLGFTSLGRAAGVSGTGRGTARSVGEIEAAREDRLATSIAEGSKRGETEAEAHKARLVALDATYGIKRDPQGRGIIQMNSDQYDKYKAEVVSENQGYQQFLKNEGARAVASTNYINLIAANQKRDVLNDTANIVQSSVQSGVLDYSQAFRMETPNANNYNSIRFGQRQRSQQRQFGFEQYVNQQEAEMRDERAKDPLTAPFKALAHYGARALKSAANSADETQDRLDTDLQIRSGNQQFEASGNMSRARMSRNTRDVIDTQYNNEMKAARNLPPEMQQSASDAASAHRDEQLQSLGDRQLALGGHQALGLAVSGLMAQAFGPGANAMRRRASILSIAGGAEEQAQGLLRDSTLGDPKERLGFADSARQLGINQLETYRASYIQGFRSKSVGVQEIAPGNQDSAEPGKVMSGIDDGVNNLRAKLGSTNIASAGGANAMVPTLIQQIIHILTTGGVGTVQP